MKKPVMTRRALVLVVGLLLAHDGAAQDSLAERLASRYARERAGAVEETAKAARPVQNALLSHPNPRVRAGASIALGAVGRRDAAELLIRVVDSDEDPEVRSTAAAALWRAALACSLDVNELGLGGAIELEREAVSIVRERLAAMRHGGTTWTHHAALGVFAPMGDWGVRALARIVGDEDVRIDERCLAALCLGRVDSGAFWIDESGAASRRLRALLLDSYPALQTALLYAASAFAPNTPAFSAEIARFAREDAFGENVIQAALYCLYTLPDDDIVAARADAVPCAADFIDVFHSQLVIYNGAQLFKRLEAPELIDRAWEVLTEEPSFAGYWLFSGLMNNFAFLDDDECEKRTRELLEWGLSEANPIPQIRGAAAWHWRDRYGELPERLDIERVLADIRESIAKIHRVPVDPDNYAQRSGADILAHLGDPLGADAIRPLLTHHSEAVRMVAAMSAGEGGYTVLADELGALAAKPAEYAAFGAAYGLMKLDDARALPAFCDILGCGNSILARPALHNLRTITGKTLVEGSPKTPSAWRARSEAWRAASRE